MNIIGVLRSTVNGRSMDDKFRKQVAKTYSLIFTDEDFGRSVWYISSDVLWLMHRAASVNGAYYKWQIDNELLWVWGDNTNTWKWLIEAHHEETL